jgi:uncharacterized membrane protein
MSSDSAASPLIAVEPLDATAYAGVSLFIAVVMAAYGYSKRSLNTSGALAAVAVGFVTFYSGYVFGLVLIAFFLSSSRITKVKSGKS